MSFTIILPRWKTYLYSLRYRYRLFKWINTGVIELGFSKQEVFQLRNMFSEYVKKEIQRKPRAFQYQELIDVVHSNLFAVEKETEIINKLLVYLNKIKPKELIMEIKDVKEFAVEVGLSAKETKGLDIDELIVEVIKKIDPKNKYSQEFISWYDALDDAYIDAADSGKPVVKTTNSKESNTMSEETVEVSELLEVVAEMSKKDDLLAVIEEYSSMFDGLDVSKMKLATQVKKAMKEHLESLAAASGDSKIDDEETEQLVEAINEAAEVSELKEIAEMEDFADVFKGIKFREGKGRGAKDRDLDAVKSEMLSALGLEEEVEEVEEVEEADEVVVDLEMIETAEAAEDKDTLLAICEELGIELKSLEKRSVKIMAKKAKEAVPEKPSKRNVSGKGAGASATIEEEDVEAEETEKTSVFQVVEEMVVAGESDKAIVAAVTPLYEAMGKKTLFIKKHVAAIKALVEQVQ